MIDITNLIYTKVKAAVIALYSAAKVEKQYQNTASTFPYVTVIDLDTAEIGKTLDYAQRKYRYSCQIDIYMTGGTKEIVAKKIRDAVAAVLENELHMQCITSKPVTNTADTTIYRYVMRYDCKIDEDTQRIYS
jgi:pyruvate/2-oxoglutarate dehydrogenase complex dihydrolipoamide dehydrogenase (E3) component